MASLETQIAKLREAPDYEAWLESTSESAADYESGTLSAYLLRLLAPDTATKDLLEELRNEHENLIQVIEVLSGGKDYGLLDAVRAHEELDEYLENVACDLPQINTAVSDLHVIRLIASDAQLKKVRNELDLSEDEQFMRQSCERILDGVETPEDIEAVHAGAHPADEAASEAASNSSNALDDADRESLRQLQQDLRAKGSRNARQERWLSALSKIV